MNATLPSSLPSNSRIWLLALTLTACGIETKPIENPALAGSGTDGGAGAGSGSTSGAGGGGRSGSGGGGAGKSGSGGKAGAAGEATAGSGEAGEEAGAGAGGDAAGAGAGGEGGSAGGEPACDEEKSPKDEPCLIADQYAVFVASDGVDGAAGTKDAPVKTVGAGIALAKANEVSRVIVCGGTVYAETVEITAGIKVYGGFECDDEWEHTGASTLVQPSERGEALRIVDVEDAVLIEDMDFKSQDAQDPGESSVAAIVKGSDAVSLKGVKITAGTGRDAANATTQGYALPHTGAQDDQCVSPTAPCIAGHPSIGATGGAQRDYMCPAGEPTRGGAGGRYNDDNDPAVAEAGLNGRPEALGGIGGPGSMATGCAHGGDGAEGSDGDPGDGALVLGVLDGVIWKPAAGGSGTHGKVGGGGGGGGAQKPSGGHEARGGGGGGGGGCGGAGGAGGAGGGASIALIAIDSQVALFGSTLAASDAGDGGDADQGQNGTGGGVFGPSSMNGDNVGCHGGAGGPGGNGGAGGGGAGGISVGVIWTGTEPSIDDGTQITFGAAGDHGEGGAETNDGADGFAGLTLDI